jgi:hypothetical protein
MGTLYCVESDLVWAREGYIVDEDVVDQQFAHE